MTEQRRLAAILVADVVGYSKLVGSDETGTLQKLAALRRDLIDPAVSKHGGRLFKSVGDGFLVEFASAVQAVTCAAAIQTAKPSLPLRIGIHVGDVVVQDDDLLGDGVNIAARIEGAAEPGGIVISRAVHEQVRDRLDLTFADKGEVTLKNIARPVHVFTLAAASAPVQAQVLALPDKPSIAVLPFQNMSGDPEQEYFVDGIAEDIITALSRFRDLFVIARNSSFTYKGKPVDVRQAARELGVRHVLEGSSRKAGNRVRVTAQLIDCESGSHLWAERYDRDLTDIFAIQEEITRAIVAAIAPAIQASALERIRRVPPANLTAYELAMRALSEADAAYVSADPESRDRATASARRALEIDPGCVLAWVVVAMLGWQSAFYSRSERTQEMCQPGLDAARRAIDLDRSEHRAYIARGLLSLEVRRYDDALADLRQACDLNPNDAFALQALAYAELMNGEAPAAKNHGLEALRLNPRDPMRYNVASFLSNACFFTGEYAEGLKWVAESKREHPGFIPTIRSAVKLYVGLGQIEQARAEASQIRSPEMEAQVRAGASILRRPEDRERHSRALRTGFGLDMPGPSDTSEAAPGLALPDKPSIAVLPFQNMSGDPEQEYFVDGLVEDIITALSRFKSLFVIARNSSFTYKGRAVDIKQVGRELGVRYVLEGSVRKTGSRVRITGQLIDAASGAHIWANRFDRDMTDIFALQDEATQSVVAAVEPNLRFAEIARKTHIPTQHLGAYDLYLRALAEFDAFTKSGLIAAEALSRRAVVIDPNYSDAWALLAQTLFHLLIGGWRTGADATEEAKQAAVMATKVGPENGLAYAVAGAYPMLFGESIDQAVELVDRAIALHPNSEVVQQCAGWTFLCSGEFDTALGHLETGLRIAPLGRAAGPLLHGIALARFFQRDFRSSIDQANRALAKMSENPNVWRVKAAALAHAGRIDEAHDALRQSLAKVPESSLSATRTNFRHQWMRDLYLDGLRKAGLPE